MHACFKSSESSGVIWHKCQGNGWRDSLWERADTEGLLSSTGLWEAPWHRWDASAASAKKRPAEAQDWGQAGDVRRPVGLAVNLRRTLNVVQQSGKR
jgi:hypothetical protein